MSAPMTTPSSPLTLAHWRRTVAEMYAAVRAASVHDPAAAAAQFRAKRDRLFLDHPESPIAPADRRNWHGASWYPYEASWRIVGKVSPAMNASPFEIPLAADGVMRCKHVGAVSFRWGDAAAELALYWLEGYGGGLWLPFADATCGDTTYGGGRYLYDTIKGADLGADDNELVLDFNFAYNPSCAYDERWSCPLSPQENKLPFAVTAGERLPVR